MRKIVCLLFVLLNLFASAQVTVMTYNIRNSNANDGVNNWDNRKEKLFALVHKVNPDVLGTQEVLKDQLKDMQRAFPEYSAYGAGRNNGKHGGEHSAIFYRKAKYDLVTAGNFWLSETPQVAGTKSWDAAITRICTWVKLKEKNTGKEFLVFNTHFDHKGKEARKKSAALVRLMVDSLAGNSPAIVTGDFNFTPADEGYAIMTSTNNRVPLTDSYNASSSPYTCCGFNVSNSKCNRIDYIFYSPHFTPVAYTVHADNDGTYYPSDHLAVSVVLNKP